MEFTPLSEKEKAALDKRIEKLQDKVYEAKKKYDALADQLNELLIKRYPERQAEYIKEALYEAYRESDKSLDLIISYMLNDSMDEEEAY